MNISRLYPLPNKSFFLFGPRGTGKSTWVRENFHPSIEVNLLIQQTFLKLQNNPSLLGEQLASLKKKSWVFIDEVQKLPSLLDEVHHLIERNDLRFILTGSSARKLKRGGANLLAGRALTHKMFPFSLRELKTKNIKYHCTYGTLPLALKDPESVEQTLYSYVETYLREEIKEEALVRKLDQFNRFLQIAARLNGQVLNYGNIARETGRSSVIISQWYDILEETLLGSRLMPYRPGFKVRESGHPKFYWFDPGVARVSAQIDANDFGSTEMGSALETLVLNELRIYQECSQRQRPIHYYETPGAGEIDFVIQLRPKTIDRPAEFMSVEVKASQKWKSDFEAPSRALKVFAKEKYKKMIGVYLGPDRLKRDGFEVYPLVDFINGLHTGEIF